MQQSFEYQGHSGRIIFGEGSMSRTGEILSDLGCSRALVLSTPFQKETAQKLAGSLGRTAAGLFSEAAMHTPVDITEKALETVKGLKADCTIAFGGGSTTGLGKAIAYRTDLPQIVIPTTYAGSEVTPILGQTEHGRKTTLKSPSVLPEAVIYDPAQSRGLPVAMSVTSGINAIAHAVEALYAKDRNPISSLMAAEGISALVKALPAIKRAPEDVEARSLALYGTWLCGSVLGTVGMALHHKLCHTLGGAFDLPHAETHAVVLPHAVAYNAAVVPELLTPLAEALGTKKPGLGLFDFARSLEAPPTLQQLGMPEESIDRATDLALANPYWNPRPIERGLIRRLIEKAYFGEPPTR